MKPISISEMPDEQKDGRDVLLWSYRCDDASIGRWNGKAWIGRCNGFDCIEYQSDFRTDYREIELPDHWHPLPRQVEKKWADTETFLVLPKEPPRRMAQCDNCLKMFDRDEDEDCFIGWHRSFGDCCQCGECIRKARADAGFPFSESCDD